MCGICGFINRDGRPASPDTLAKMNATIVHRGPDDSGEEIFGSAALGFRRLSIVDLAGGHQPMRSRSGPEALVFNGEIYNHLDLRRELENRGAEYRTSADSETILHGYQVWGKEVVERLRGMFAFAILNPDTGELFLGRDRLGIKPLYLYRSGGLFAFASEIKALLAHPEIRAEVNTAKLPVQLSLKYTLDEETLFRGITKLPPGHILSLSSDGEALHRYWNLSFTPKETFTSEAEAEKRFAELFDDSVKARLMADVPLGVFLSGGIDSSVIASSMAREVTEPIKSYTVAFAEAGYSEFEFSRAVAKHIGSDMREITVTPEEFFSSWPRMLYHEDEPIAHPSSIPLHFVSKLAAKEVKVVLTGEGADELLGGYERYYQTLINVRYGKFVPAGLRTVARSLIDMLPDTFSGKRKAVRTSLYLPTDIDTIFLDNYAAMPRSLVDRALRPEYRASSPEAVYAGFSQMMAECDADNLLEKILYADIKSYLLELLMKQDQMSMSASLESRVPFLDHPLVEFVCQLPVSYKIKGFETKRILRRALGHTAPPQITTRSKKGFPTPTKEWFRGAYYPVIERLLLSDNSLSSEYFDREFVSATLSRHRSGQWDLQESIWTLANFEIWLRIFIDGQAPEEVFGDAEEVRTCASSG